MGQDRSPPWRLPPFPARLVGYSSGFSLPLSRLGAEPKRPFCAQSLAGRRSVIAVWAGRSPKSSWFDLLLHLSRRHATPRPEGRPPISMTRVGKRSNRRGSWDRSAREAKTPHERSALLSDVVRGSSPRSITIARLVPGEGEANRALGGLTSDASSFTLAVDVRERPEIAGSTTPRITAASGLRRTPTAKIYRRRWAPGDLSQATRGYSLQQLSNRGVQYTMDRLCARGCMHAHAHAPQP